MATGFTGIGDRVEGALQRILRLTLATNTKDAATPFIAWAFDRP